MPYNINEFLRGGKRTHEIDEAYRMLGMGNDLARLRGLFLMYLLSEKNLSYQDLKDIVKPNQGHLIASSACLGSQLDKFLLRYMDTGDSEYYDTAMRWCQYIVDILTYNCTQNNYYSKNNTK